MGLTRSEPWFLIGDFNEITGNHEKEGGTVRPASSFISFNNMITNCGLVDFQNKGNKLSWKGRRSGQNVRCRLDRGLATEEWHEMFPYSYVEYLRMIGSDHRPLVASFNHSRDGRRKRQFKFDKRWLGQAGLMESIEKGWKAEPHITHQSLMDRVINCRHEISKWRKVHRPYGKDRISELQNLLEEVQTDDS